MTTNDQILLNEILSQRKKAVDVDASGGIRKINHISIESAKLARGRQMPELDQLPFPKVQVLGFKRMVSGIGNESTTAGGCIVQMIQSITLAFCDGLGGHGVLL